MQKPRAWHSLWTLTPAGSQSATHPEHHGDSATDQNTGVTTGGQTLHCVTADLTPTHSDNSSLCGETGGRLHLEVNVTE